MPSQEGLKETTDLQSMRTLLPEWPFPHLYIRDNKICHVPALSSERRWNEGQGINGQSRRNTLICEPFRCGMDRVKKGLIQFCTKCFQVGSADGHRWKSWKISPQTKGRKKEAQWSFVCQEKVTAPEVGIPIPSSLCLTKTVSYSYGVTPPCDRQPFPPVGFKTVSDLLPSVALCWFMVFTRAFH